METPTRTAITVKTNVGVPVTRAWEMWNEPAHITKWCFASDDWHAPHSENDLRVGGMIKTTMAAKDGSVSFDFGGTYTKVNELKEIDYTLGDGRKVSVVFIDKGERTEIIETFEAEDQNPVEMQRDGWQAILENYRKYAEANL